MDGSYPPGSFSFQVSFSGSGSNNDAAFQEASGIDMEMKIEEVGRGGENRFKYRLPGKVKYNNLILKRGLVTKDSPFFIWCKNTLDLGLSEPVKPQELTVALLDEKQNTLISWVFQQAYPVKWSVSDIRSTENAYAVESIEFAFTYYENQKTT